MLVQIIKDNKKLNLLKGMFICIEDEQAETLIKKGIAKKG